PNYLLSSARVRSPFRAASATFALKVGVWFRRGRLFMVSPDSLGTACPLSSRNSTYRLVQISETSSNSRALFFLISRLARNSPPQRYWDKQLQRFSWLPA